MEVSRDY